MKMNKEKKERVKARVRVKVSTLLEPFSFLHLTNRPSIDYVNWASANSNQPRPTSPATKIKI